jgi:hypothetical protein
VAFNKGQRVIVRSKLHQFSSPALAHAVVAAKAVIVRVFVNVGSAGATLHAGRNAHARCVAGSLQL